MLCVTCSALYSRWVDWLNLLLLCLSLYQALAVSTHSSSNLPSSCKVECQQWVWHKVVNYSVPVNICVLFFHSQSPHTERYSVFNHYTSLQPSNTAVFRVLNLLSYWPTISSHLPPTLLVNLSISHTDMLLLLPYLNLICHAFLHPSSSITEGTGGWLLGYNCRTGHRRLENCLD